MKPCSNIFFLRHLKTQNNKLHIISGQSNSEIIKEECLKINLERFDKIYCSPSQRCIKTLEMMSKQFESLNKVLYDERLLERNMGVLEGLSKKECSKKYSELFVKETFNVFKTPPQGESFKCFKNRINEFFIENLSTDKNSNILICSHNQSLKLLRLLSLEKDVTYQTWTEFSFKNGEIVEILK